MLGRKIPRTLSLLRFDEAANGWGTVRVLDVTPYTEAGLTKCAEELRHQAFKWEQNYTPFFGAEWKVSRGPLS